MTTSHRVWVLCAGLLLASGCQRNTSGAAPPGASAEPTSGGTACAREPGEPPVVGEGASQATERPCVSTHSVMGESAKRPDEL